MKFWVKVQRTEGSNGEEVLVGACDEELLGKEIEHLKISESFFKGELVSEEEAIKKIEKATIANLVGTNIIYSALKHNLVSNDSVKNIAGVPHAQIVLLN